MMIKVTFIGNHGGGGMKKNCWEFKKCGCQPGGQNVSSFGICPVTTQARLNGKHDGMNAGRACWVISNTLCDKKVQGDFNQKFANCMKCEFYRLVKEEEGGNFIHSNRLLKKLRTGED
jgi:hypothetical protein